MDRYSRVLSTLTGIPSGRNRLMLCMGMMKQSRFIVDKETGSVLVIPYCPPTLPFLLLWPPPLGPPFAPPPPPPKVTDGVEVE